MRESKVIGKIITKLFERYDNLSQIAIGQFYEDTGIEIKSPSETQFFTGWLTYDFLFPGGKSFLSLIRETVMLNDDELTMVNNLQNGITGFFKILSEGKVKDLITEKEYNVEIIDFKDIPVGKTVRCRLVKNFSDKYFFFGGVQVFEEKDIKMALDAFWGCELWDESCFAETIGSEDIKEKMRTMSLSQTEEMNFICRKCSCKISTHNKDWHAGMCDDCFNKDIESEKSK